MPTMFTADTIQQKAIEALKQVYDPELPVNIYDLGLIYKVDWHAPAKKLTIVMTLTTPNCPAAEWIPNEVKKTLLSIPEVQIVDVQITFDPPYSLDRLSEEARLLLGW